MTNRPWSRPASSSSPVRPEGTAGRTSLDAKNTDWRRQRVRQGSRLLALGLVGLALPVLPGVLLVGGGMWLLFPNQTERIYRNLRTRLRR